ncbi:MAG: hypothetical protein IT460_06530 [Planctomycetes bacterium]|nr:hypothetical protein [Planctomycetota bacterium]
MRIVLVEVDSSPDKGTEGRRANMLKDQPPGDLPMGSTAASSQIGVSVRTQTVKFDSEELELSSVLVHAMHRLRLGDPSLASEIGPLLRFDRRSMMLFCDRAIRSMVSPARRYEAACFDAKVYSLGQGALLLLWMLAAPRTLASAGFLGGGLVLLSVLERLATRRRGGEAIGILRSALRAWLPGTTCPQCRESLLGSRVRSIDLTVECPACGRSVKQGDVAADLRDLLPAPRPAELGRASIELAQRYRDRWRFRPLRVLFAVLLLLLIGLMVALAVDSL